MTTNSNSIGLQSDTPLQRPLGGGLLPITPGQMPAPQGIPQSSGMSGLPPPPPSSMTAPAATMPTATQDAAPPRFPPTQPGLLSAAGPPGLIGPPRLPTVPIQPPGPPPQSLRSPLIPPGSMRPPGPPPPPAVLHPSGPPSSPGLLGIPGTTTKPLIIQPTPLLATQPIQPNPPPNSALQQQQRMMAPPPGEPFWLEHKSPDGKVYYSNPITHETTWQRPANVLVRQGPAFVSPTGQQPQAIPATPPSAPTTPAAPAAPPRLPFPGSGSALLVPTKVWSEHKNSEGKIYFYNKITLQSVWEKPKDFDLILPMPVALASASLAGEATTTTAIATPDGDVPKDVNGQQQGDASLQPSALATSDQSTPQPSGDGDSTNDAQKDETSADVKVEAMEVDATTTTAPQTSAPSEPAPEGKGKEKPITSLPVVGTPWSLVWTSDGRVFFFNATQRKSYWQIPIELEKNKKVREMLDPSERKAEKRPGELVTGVDIKRSRVDEEDSDDEAKPAAPPNPPVLAEIPEKTVHVKVALKEIDKMQQEAKTAEMRARMSLEERQAEFTKMMLERGVSAFSTWEKELPKIVFDPRYNFLNPKERKQAYDAFILTRAEDERREKKAKLKEIRDDFRKLMEEFKVSPRTIYTEFSHKCNKDERFLAIEKSRERESMFEEYRSELKKQSRKAEQSRRESVPTPKSTTELRADFVAMLSEDKSLHYKSKWKDVRGSFRDDPRYQAVDHSSQREDWFYEHVKKLEKSEKHKKDKKHSHDRDRREDKKESQEDLEKVKQKRIEASIKERELEVQRSRSEQKREWEEERESLRKMEAKSQFKLLLGDLVRQSTASWHSTKKTLKKDSRWELVEQLGSPEQEKMFGDHVSVLVEKRKKQFQKLLEDTTELTLVTSWKKAKKLIKKDPRYELFGEDDNERESEYSRYRRDKKHRCKEEFRSLLRETKCITYRSKKSIKESDKHMKEIHEVLKNDQRYLVLDCIAEDREEILTDYIKELDRKGPPPPPTATNPLERLRRT